MSNLKQIGLALRMYAEDNGGALPPNLETLTSVGHITDPACYVCPTHSKLNQTHPEAMKMTYCYISGLRSDDPSHFVVAFDEEWNHEQMGYNALYMAGHVTWLAGIPRLHAEIERQRKELSAKGRTMALVRPDWSRWPDQPVGYGSTKDNKGTAWSKELLITILVGAGVALLVLIGLTRRPSTRVHTPPGAPTDDLARPPG